MTKEELYSLIYEDPEVYKPPVEEHSLMLEATHGCSYHRCYFCDFTRDEYYHFPPQAIRQKLSLLAMIAGDNPRLHLLGNNPFCLPTRRLAEIAEMVHAYLPAVREISMYARADDINRKGASDVRLLRDMGITDLHVGLESGSDTVLKLHNKGESVADIERALSTLSDCGMNYHLSAIPGMGGKKLSHEHAVKTAAVLSRLTPVTVWCMALKVWPGTVLQHMVDNGMFDVMTPREILIEEREMLALTNMQKKCKYVDSTVLNSFTVSASLPSGKDWLLEQIDELLATA